MVRVRTVVVVGGYSVRLEFTDGTEATVDLAPYLHGPVFEPLKRDPALFAAVKVDSQLGTIVWPNGADIAPETLRAAASTPAAVASPRGD